MNEIDRCLVSIGNVTDFQLLLLTTRQGKYRDLWTFTFSYVENKMPLCRWYPLSHLQLNTSCLVTLLGRRINFLRIQCSDPSVLFFNMVVIWYKSYKLGGRTLNFCMLLAFGLSIHISLN